MPDERTVTALAIQIPQLEPNKRKIILELISIFLQLNRKELKNAKEKGNSNS